MECVIPVPTKRHMLVWLDSDLKNTDPQNLHKICILSKVLDHVMDLKQDNIYGINW